MDFVVVFKLYVCVCLLLSSTVCSWYYCWLFVSTFVWISKMKKLGINGTLKTQADGKVFKKTK